MKNAILVTTSVVIMGLGAGGLPASAFAAAPDSQPRLMLAAAQSHHGEGVVTAIDKKGKRIEFKHGPIKSLGWMGMQMYFSIDDMELLDEVKVGDKVGFDFIQTNDKRFVVTDIEVK